MKGKFFVLDGVDGSGKETQTKLIVERLKKDGYDVLEVDFPRYGEKSAGLVEDYLNGVYGSFDEVTPKQASIFYAVDRFAASKEIKEHLDKGGIIISNRYVSSNQIHQAGKIKDPNELEEFLKWLDKLEFEIFNIPRPDKVFFLNVPYKIGMGLVLKKKDRAYIKGDKKTDIHEESDSYMKMSYKRALSLVKRYDYWEEILCYKNSNLRTIEDISQELYKRILNELK